MTLLPRRRKVIVYSGDFSQPWRIVIRACSMQTIVTRLFQQQKSEQCRLIYLQNVRFVFFNVGAYLKMTNTKVFIHLDMISQLCYFQKLHF